MDIGQSHRRGEGSEAGDERSQMPQDTWSYFPGQGTLELTRTKDIRSSPTLGSAPRYWLAETPISATKALQKVERSPKPLIKASSVMEDWRWWACCINRVQ